MHFRVEIVFDGIHASDAAEAARIARRQMVEGGLITMRVWSENGTGEDVGVRSDGTSTTDWSDG